MLIVLPIAIGAITAAVSDLYLGSELSIRECLERGVARMVPLMVTYVIFSVILAVAAGLSVLAFSVIREKLFTHRHDPYKEIER